MSSGHGPWQPCVGILVAKPTEDSSLSQNSVCLHYRLGQTERKNTHEIETFVKPYIVFFESQHNKSTLLKRTHSSVDPPPVIYPTLTCAQLLSPLLIWSTTFLFDEGPN